MVEIQKTINGVKDDKPDSEEEDAAAMTDDEKRNHAAKFQAVIRESMRVEYEARRSIR